MIDVCLNGVIDLKLQKKDVFIRKIWDKNYKIIKLRKKKVKTKYKK